MSNHSFTRKATLTIATVVVFLFLTAVPVIYVVERAHSETAALARLDAFGRTVAAEQQRRFTKVAQVEREAIARMQALLGVPRPAAAAVLDRDFPVAADGTRRSTDALFDGAARSDGSVVSGIGGFISQGREMPPAHGRLLVAAYDALRASSGGIGPELSSLYFFTPQNDIIVHAPQRADRLQFYRKTAPAGLDFQPTNVARIMTVANNPERRLRCTDLERATFDPTGRTWTTGCMTPIDIGGRHVGSWGVSLLLDELPVDTIVSGLPGATTIIVSSAGQLIFHPGLTRQTDRATGRYLDLARSTDPELRALWAFVKARPGSRFLGEVPALDAYVALYPVPTPGWHVVTLMPRSVVLAQSVRSAMTFAIIGLVAGITAIVLFWIFIRRSVGKPLIALAGRAEAIAAASGRAVPSRDLNTNVPEEIARLGASFEVMEEAISAEHKRLTRSFDLLARTVENHAIYMFDRNGRITSWNRGAEHLTGSLASEALGQPIESLVRDGGGGSDAAAPAALQDRARANGSAVAEGWRLHRDGSRFWASIVTEAVRDASGELVGFAEIMRDISDERQQRLTLEENVRLLTLAEDMAEIGHWRLRIGDDKVDWSAGTYRIHGVPPGTEVSLALVMSHYAPSHRDDVAAVVDSLAKVGGINTMTTTITRGDGERRLVTILSLAEYGESGAVAAVFGVMRDITDETAAKRQLTEAREAAEAAAAARADLLATMSHEIRTPMTGILGMLDLLRDTGGTLPPTISLAGVARSARTLMVVLDDVLEHSRLDRGAVEIETLVFDLDALVEQTAQLFRPLAASKGFAITVEAGTLGWVTGDPSRVQQVLSNLVGNAVKFTAAGGVRVSGRREAGNLVRIDVEDHGIGIAADVLPTLFTAFRQADAGTARVHGGSGLGLSISRRLAEAMGGSIEATSVMAQGSCFTVALPLPTAPQPAGDEALPQLLVTRGGAPPRILVVEDTETTRHITEIQLQALGCIAVAAGDGMAALAALFARQFDAVLIDGQMPVLGGAATIQLARLLPHGGDVPFIGFTAGASGAVQALRDAGADAVLAKPYDRQRLVARLQDALARPRAAMEAGPAPAALLTSLPAAVRGRLAESAAADMARLAAALDVALADGDGGGAQAALHALAGVASTLGDGSLAARCAFAEALLQAADIADCRWLGAAVTDQTLTLQARMAAALHDLDNPVR